MQDPNCYRYNRSQMKIMDCTDEDWNSSNWYMKKHLSQQEFQKIKLPIVFD